MSYEVMNYLSDGSVYNITPLLRSIRWGGDIRQTARKLEADLAIGRDANLPKYDAPLGSLMMLLGDGVELFRGVVFENQKNTEGNRSIVSYEHSIYLLNNKATRNFSNMTADAITRQLCADFKVGVGGLPSPGIALTLLLRDLSIYDMILIAWTETAKRNGKKYQIRMNQGNLTVIEKGAQTVRWLITENQNLISAEYRENINEMKNQIVVVGDKDQVLATVRDDNLIRQYGLLQELQQEGDIQSSEAQVIAQNMLKQLGKVTQEATITCLGLDDVVAGTAIEVKESLTGLVGTFYVDTDDHTIENGKHTMELKLNWTDEVATEDAPKENE